MNPLSALRDAGQSVWLEFLRRGLITNGGLQRRIRRDAVIGVTSNPTISWRIVEPLPGAWTSDPAASLPCYRAGTWGPREADLLLEREHRRWRRP